MTRARIAMIGVATLCGVAILAVAVFFIARQSLQSNTSHETVAACGEPSNEYSVAIQNDTPSINDIHARRCDKLTITNQDSTLRLIAFGVHDHHQTYNGMEEKMLAKGQSLTVTLDQTGTFMFHDHFNDHVQGAFTVAE